MSGDEHIDPVPLSRNRDFSLLWSGQAVSEFGSQVSTLALTLLVLDVTGSAAKAGLLAFVSTATALVLRLPSGAVADRGHRRALMLCCEAGRAIALGTVALALLFGTPTFGHLLAVAFVESALAVLFGPAQVAVLRHVVPRSQLADGVARNQARSQAVGLIGQPAGGALYGLGQAVPFVVDAVSYAVSFVAVMSIKSRLDDPEREPPAGNIQTEIAEGVKWLWRRHFLRTSVLWLGGLSMVFQAIGLVSLVIARNLGASPTEIGILYGLCSAGALAGALSTSFLRRRLSTRAVVRACGWSAAAVTPLIAVAPSGYLIGMIGAVAFFFVPVVNAAVLTDIVTSSPDRMQGRVSSAARQLSTAATPLGPLAGGLLLSGIGDHGTVFACAAALAVLAVVATVLPWDGRRGDHGNPTVTEPGRLKRSRP